MGGLANKSKGKQAKSKASFLHIFKGVSASNNLTNKILKAGEMDSEVKSTFCFYRGPQFIAITFF